MIFLAALAFALAWIFAVFGGPGAVFFHPIVLAYLGLFFLAMSGVPIGTVTSRFKRDTNA